MREKKINQKLIKKSLLRGGIPFAIMEIFAIALYVQGKSVDSKDLFFGGFILLVLGGATVIYNIDHWSLMKQSMVHFIIMLATVFPILLLSGWYPVSSFVDGLQVFVIFALVGIVIWSIFLTLAKVFKW